MPTTYAIPDGRTVMAATTYTGNGGTQSVSNAVNGVSFQPDFVWIKSRSAAYYNTLYDSVRGSGATKSIYSNSTDAEGAYSVLTNLSSFNSNGFTVGTTSSSPNTLNESGATFVGWQWKAGGTSASNTNGSITSTVSVGATQGFSVVTYTGTGANATVGHGLGVAPSMIIVKKRSGANAWFVGATPAGWNKYLLLNTTDASATDPGTVWQATAPTSSVFYLGTTGEVNANTATFVAYCFSAVAGYSAFGSFTGNGSADGPFVYTGFRPAFVMAKLSSATGDWNMVDDMRQTYNDASGNPVLRANTSGAEEDVDTMQGQMDILSNGFKLRSNNSSLNASGGTIIYAAFAKSPFKFANAR